jgi:hypothetical protein
MSVENDFAINVKKMITGIRNNIVSNPLPDNITQVQQKENQIARDAQLELLNVIISGINRIESMY